jgi:PHD/YefM family antitoxin component YafN of YafNO toxin-antitoxin module
MKMNTTKMASVSSLRERLSNYIDELPEDQVLMVVRHSKPAAYLLAPEVYEAILEQLEASIDLKDMVQHIKDFLDSKDVMDARELFDELGL